MLTKPFLVMLTSSRFLCINQLSVHGLLQKATPDSRLPTPD